MTREIAKAPKSGSEMFDTRRVVSTLEGLMTKVTEKDVSPDTVNAACNCADKIVDILRLPAEPWCPGSGRSPTVKTTDTLRAFFFHGWQMAPFPLHLSGTTCERCDGTGIYPASISSTGGSPVRTSASAAMAQAWKASGLSFSLRLLDSRARFDRASSSWKMLQPSLFEGLIASPPNFPRSGMTVAGTCYELAMWERPTKERGGGFWPTPTARDYKSPGLRRTRKALDTRRQAMPLSVVFKERYGYRLPASFVEWLMGYAPGHTVLEPWAMQWYRSARAKRSAD